MVGADKWRNPDEDLPADFEVRRAENYAKLRKPLDPTAFIAELRRRCAPSSAALDDHAAEAGLAGDRRAARPGAIKLTAARAAARAAQPAPAQDRRSGRGGAPSPLIDMLKEAVLRTGCLDARHLGRPARGDLDAPRCWPSGCCWPSTPTAPTPASGPSPPASTATARTRSATSGAAT